MKKLALLILTCLATAAYCPGAIPVKVGVRLHPPFTIKGEPGQPPTGFFIDVLNEIARKNDWSLTFTVDTEANLLNKLSRQEIDLLMPAYLPFNGSANLDYTAGLITSHATLYVPADIPPPSLHELQGKSIALVDNDLYSKPFLDLLKTLGVRYELIAMQSYKEVFASLSAGRVDAGLVDHLFGEVNARAANLSATPAATSAADFSFAFSRGRNGTLRQTIDRELILLKNTPESPYFKALNKWTAYHQPTSPLFITLLSLFGLLILSGITLGTILLVRRSIRIQMDKLNTINRQLRQGTEDLINSEAATLDLKNWYQTLLNTTPDILLVHGVDAKGVAGKFIDANTKACERLGYSRQELLALSPKQIEVNPDSSTTPRYGKMLSAWRNARLPDAEESAKIIQPLTLELSYRTKTGGEFPAEVTLRILEHNGHPVIFYYVHDITSRQKTRSALQERERRFSDFFSRAPIGVTLFDPAQKVTEVNQAALAMFGFSERAQFAETKIFNLAELGDQNLQTLMKGGTIRYETVIDFDETRKDQRNASNRTGKCHFDILITNLGLDDEFNPKGYMLQIQDITERRRAEDALRQNEKMLRQAQKMEAIGTLAGGIAHDFNNILTPIIGYTEMSIMALPPKSPVRRNLDEALKASLRAKELVKQILTFSRQSEHEVKPIRLIPLLKEVTQLLRGSVLPSIEIRLDIKSEQDIIKADPTQIHQVIMNLCTNAIHAMQEKGGLLEIGMRPLQVDSRTHGPFARLRFGSYVEVLVCDSGHGMERAVLERIFEPFFTTKRSGEGTGMGLAVVHGIIISLHGSITAESEVGKGTTFHIALPLLEQMAEQSESRTQAIPRGNECILFVDDELGITNMASQMLNSLGYKVITSMRPYDAVTLFREDPARFDLIISDQIMPGLNGMDLVREIHALRADIPALICTGFSRNVDDSELLKAGITEVLMKPLVLRQLAEAIRRALDSGKKDQPKS